MGSYIQMTALFNCTWSVYFVTIILHEFFHKEKKQSIKIVTFKREQSFIFTVQIKLFVFILLFQFVQNLFTALGSFFSIY
jgi:hypothetical protein